MIFVGGIHGVGKSYFCKIAKDELNINTYSASKLIEDLKQEVFAKDKLIVDIDGNQPYLLKAIEELNKSEGVYLLDGHFCLLNANGEVHKIEIETFLNIHPKGVLLLTEDPAIIAERRETRDNIKSDISVISRFQMLELEYATEVSKRLDIPIHITKDSHEIQGGIDFIKRLMETMDREANG